MPAVSQLHFIGGEKGGVGKSVVARLLAQYWIDRSKPLAALDADTSGSVLLRHYGDFTQSVDLALPDSADQIFDRALGKERNVIVDLPAQSASSLRSWLFGANVLGLASELGIGVTFWHVSDGGFASVRQIESALDTYASRARHVLVKNHGRSRDFSQFESSPAREKLGELSGTEFDLPELDAGAMYKVDSEGLSFWAAINADTTLRPLERQRVKLWLEQCYAKLDALVS